MRRAPVPVFALLLLDSATYAWPLRGTINASIVEANSAKEVVRFSAHDGWTNHHLRYLTILDVTADGGQGRRKFAFTARACEGACTDGFSLPPWRTFAFSINNVDTRSFGMPTQLTEIVSDYSMSHNMVVKRDNATFYAVGGQHGGLYWNSRPPELRDGLRLLQSSSWEAILAGAWRHPSHDRAGGTEAPLIIDGAHLHCVSMRKERNGGRCEYDGRVALVRHRERWLIYVRANLQFYGCVMLQHP